MLKKMFNQHPTFYKWDKMKYGFFAGLVGPIAGVLLFFATQYATIAPSEYIFYITKKHVLAPLLSFGCVVNLGVFFLFIQRDYINAARGVILATFFWAIPIIWAKFF